MDKFSSKYEILTQNGWKNFQGVRKNKSKGMIVLYTSNGLTLKCTTDHKIKTPSTFIEASKLLEGDTIETKNGQECVVRIEKFSDIEFDSYDVLEVDGGNTYYTDDVISHNCSFIGSQSTLISGKTLQNLSYSTPIAESEGIKQYAQPKPDHIYVMMVDVSRGKGLDYSTFTVFDCTKMPYTQACTFRDNYVGPVDFASIIFRIGKLYNEAAILVEINDIGGQVSDTLLMEYGYENMLFTETAGRAGKRISAGFGGRQTDAGIRTTKSVKAVGCSILKLLVEQNQLILSDFETIQELSRFARKGSSYEAESGAHDDLVMNLVHFAWLTDQLYFKDITDINTLSRLREKTEQQIEEDLLPFGFIDVGEEDDLQPGFQPVQNSNWLY